MDEFFLLAWPFEKQRMSRKRAVHTRQRVKAIPPIVVRRICWSRYIECELVIGCCVSHRPDQENAAVLVSSNDKGRLDW